MGNCLKTQLKSVVNNDNLEFFGKIGFLISTDPVNYRSIQIGANVTCDIQGGTINGSTQITSNGSGYLILDTSVTIVSDGTYGDYVKILVPKYDITQLNKVDCDAEGIKYSDIRVADLFNVTNSSYFAEQFKKELTRFSLNGNFDEVVDVTDAGTNGKLTTFNLNGVNKKIKGKLDKLGMSPMTAIAFSDNNATEFTVENFVAYSVNAGRASGSINITYLGALVAYFKDILVTKQSSNPITWSADGNNTTVSLNGVSTTIHINSDNTWTRIS